MINLNIDLAGLLDIEKELGPRARKLLAEAAEDLATQTHAHIVEEAQAHLHSTREKYTNALGFRQVDESTWEINLDADAMWIEEGMGEHDMLPDLLKSPKAKTAKDGSRYLVVPFDHKKGPTKSTPAQQDLTNTIKAELKRRNIPYGSLEKDAKGNVKTGTLHSFNIMSRPTKSHDGPGQGHGPIGAVRQGNTGIPFLQGVRVIQKQIAGTQKFAKNIMTFRVASSKHKGSGKWQHPGLVPRKFFDKAAEWAIEQFLTHIAPRILNGL